jgi:phosphonatase-like hydrolase
MSKFKLVVFDMAGTTVLDKGNVADSFIEACKTFGVEVEESEVKKVMGWRKIDAIKMLLEKYKPEWNNEEMIGKIHNKFIQTMVNFYEESQDIKPLPFAEQVFEDLRGKGLKIALNTGFTQEIAQAILNKLDWHPGGKIDAVVASDEVAEGRPAPDMINKIMQALSITDNRSVVKVGDTEVDILEGRNTGCGLVVGVTTGAYTGAQLLEYKPDHVIDNLSELSSLIS